MRELVEEIRDCRLEYERDLREINREEAVEAEYNDTILRVLPWPLVSFVPSLFRVWEQTGFHKVKDLVEQEDTDATDKFCECVREALVLAVPDMQRAIMDAADEFRTALPQSWISDPNSMPVALSYQFEDSESTIDLSSLESLDRAAFVFRCRSTRNEDRAPPVHFGLDAITHRSSHQNERSYEPEYVLRSLVLQILELLELDPAFATPLDIDRLAPVLICTEHSVHSRISTIFANGIPAFTNWRDAVRIRVDRFVQRPDLE